MAVQVTLEFTDAQWALVQAHFPNTKPDDGGRAVHHDITEEELNSRVFKWVQREVESCMEESAVADARKLLENCFNV
tara:strand:+ start:356 stop:586 length:231 start_codon:yes stop_codon:yes gene_type:complete